MSRADFRGGVPTTKQLPLRSYGIKVYGREYQKWPSRYNDAFRSIIGSTCACSTADMIHANYRETFQALGFDTELPSAIDGAGDYLTENLQQARTLQQRAKALYEQCFTDRDSGGPAEDQWRHETETLVLGRFVDKQYATYIPYSRLNFH
jgi:hypothetical protein